MAKTTLILGGARSGKTAYALTLANAPRTYVATATAHDDEMRDRIAAHQAERGGDWTLVEAETDLVTAIGGIQSGTAVVDCLTLWLSNLMAGDCDVEAETNALIDSLDRSRADVVFVSNEIGMGLVPMEVLSRAFRDQQGRLNQRIAAAADRVEFVAAGLPLRLK